MPQKPIAVYVGRFQPFHNGHLLVVQGMAKVCSKVFIVIGSSDKANEANNPFSGTERRDMIQRSLQALDIIPMYDVAIIEMPDMPEDKDWTAKLLELTGPVQEVWTGNEATKKCFEGTDVHVKTIKEVPGVSSTEVRKRMRDGGDWKVLVPPDVASCLSEINGVERVKKLG